MNYNVTSHQAHFYDEESLEIGRMKLNPEQVQNDAEFSLWKHLIELGVLEGEEECVEDLFEKLNKELGIEEFDENHQNKNKRNKTGTGTGDSKMPMTPKPTIFNNNIKKVIPVRAKIPTVSSEFTVLFDIRYTSSKNKASNATWQDGGVLKYHPTLKLAECYNAEGLLLHKKTMEEVDIKEGLVIEEAAGGSIVIEICSKQCQIAEKCGGNVVPFHNNNNNTSNNDNDNSNNTNSNNIVIHRQFSILYTTDKHKKAKKWLDGRLDYDDHTNLAKFINEDSGDCFFKKVMKVESVMMGAEFETGIYLIQIDQEISGVSEKGKVCDGGVMPAVVKKQLKSTVNVNSSANAITNAIKNLDAANSGVPISGRSNAELLSLLKKKV